MPTATATDARATVGGRLDPIVGDGVTVEVLSPEGVERIHAATLEVLETVGVRFPSATARAILADHGAEVDESTAVVRMKPDLVERALATAPDAYVLGARDPALDLPLDGDHVHVGTDGCGIEVIDLETGKARRSELADVATIARVVDALDEIAFHWVPVSAQDRPAATRSLHELAAIWGASTKHVQTESVVTAREAAVAIELASVIAGGREALRKRPVLSLMQCTISPLAHDGGALDAALLAAEAGVPVGFMTMASCSFSGPATPAGNLVVGNAEVVSALVLCQLAHPGSPVYYAAAQTAMDLRSGAYTGGGPEDFLFGAATNALADFYRVPLSMGAFATGAKDSDWQAGLENGLSAFMATASGADMLLGVGLLDGSRRFSFEQLLFDAEIVAILRAMRKGIPTDDESLAIEAIREVGPGGDYLTSAHTRRHMRERWQPRLLDRRPISQWEADPSMARRTARERVDELLATHEPEPLEPGLAAELARILAAADRAAETAPSD
jgi:trimethylamine--corrinoid protein Co-methyltransferase